MMKTMKAFFNYWKFFILFLDFSTAIEFTPLEIDNHPCTPQNLKVSTYIIVTFIRFQIYINILMRKFPKVIFLFLNSQQYDIFVTMKEMSFANLDGNILIQKIFWIHVLNPFVLEVVSMEFVRIQTTVLVTLDGKVSIVTLA